MCKPQVVLRTTQIFGEFCSSKTWWYLPGRYEDTIPKINQPGNKAPRWAYATDDVKDVPVASTEGMVKYGLSGVALPDILLF